MKEVTKAINIAFSNGIKMTKKISSGGIFTTDTYDNRTIYSLKEAFKLAKEGFTIKNDAGELALDILLKLYD